MSKEVNSSHSASFRVPLDHPAFPGHFPGNPVVPGVVVLDAVIVAAEEWLGRPLRVRGLPQAKFLASLLPDEVARIDLEIQGAMLAFDVYRDDVPIAKGKFSLMPTAAP